MANPVHEAYGNRLRVRACGLLIENERLLMVNHTSLGTPEFWGPPGGGVNFGESVNDCLRRELHEEAGLETEPGAFLFACEFIQPPLHAIELFFSITRISGTLTTGHDPEMKSGEQIIKTVRFLPWDEIQKMDARSLHRIFHFVEHPAQITGLRGYFRV